MSIDTAASEKAPLVGRSFSEDHRGEPRFVVAQGRRLDIGGFCPAWRAAARAGTFASPDNPAVSRFYGLKPDPVDRHGGTEADGHGAWKRRGARDVH